MPNQISIILAAVVLLAPGMALADPPVSFSTLAGNAGYGWVDGAGVDARFNFPEGVAADALGNVYVADTQNSVVRRIDAAGAVTTLAGAAGTAGAGDGLGAEARFAYPQGLALGADGNLYVADTGNSTVRRVTPEGTVTTVAGWPGVIGSADGTNSAVGFNLPCGIAADAGGRLYVADTGNSTVRMLEPSGANWIVTTLAGSHKLSGFVDGANQNALFFQPWGIAADTNGNLYVADTGNIALRKVAASGTNWVTTTLWQGGFLGGAAVDGAGNLYVVDSGDDVILKVAGSGPNWASTVLAGSVGVAGSADGSAGTDAALFDYPRGIAASAYGLLCVADSLNNTIRQVTAAGEVSTLAGAAGGQGNADGAADQARFNGPLGLAADAQRNVYVADSRNNAIRCVSPSGFVTTLAGAPGGVAGSVDGAGRNAAFDLPAAVAVDAATNVYVADSGNNEIRKLAWAGTNWWVTTLAGRAGESYWGTITNVITNALANVTNVASVSFYPQSDYLSYFGVITNIAGVITNLGLWGTNATTVTNSSGHVATNLTITSNLGGVVANFAIGATNLYYVVTNTPLFHTNEPFYGTNFVGLLATNSSALGAAPPLLNGLGTNAIFHRPAGLALDGAGNVYVADGGTNGVRVVTPAGAVSTLAGSAGAYPVLASQLGTNRLFYHSSSVAVDGGGNVFVADAENNTIREIAPGSAALTIAGAPGLWGTADGTNSNARFASPASIALDAQGNLFVADALGDTVRRITPMGADWVVTTVGGLADAPGSADGSGSAARFNQPAGIAVDGSGNLYVADTGNDTIRLGQTVLGTSVVLQCALAGGQVVLSWPAPSEGFVLETAASLAGPGNWTAVTNVPAASGGEFAVTNAVTAPWAFYRLRGP